MEYFFQNEGNLTEKQADDLQYKKFSHTQKKRVPRTLFEANIILIYEIHL